MTFNFPVFGHTGKGHIIIVQRAMDQLTTNEQDYFNGMSKLLLTQLSSKEGSPDSKKHKHNSPTSLISRFPDDYKRLELKALFMQFGVQLPKSLTPYQNKTTSNWHYMNIPLDGTCRYNSNNISKFIPISIKAFKESIALKDKALMLSFIVHLVGDIHQPLHTHNRYNNRCIHDLGGNNYCLTIDNELPKKCAQSLHSLWDKSVGWLSEGKSVREHIMQLNRLTSPAQINSPISHWISENKNAAAFAYSTPRYKTPKKKYYFQGQAIMRERSIAASDRLALLLKGLYRGR